MVYCSRCGAQNPDDAATCKNCGAPINPPTSYRGYRRHYDEGPCFRGNRGFPVWGMVFGLFIIFVGLISLLEGVYWWASWNRLWPLFVIIVGLIIVVSALSRR